MYYALPLAGGITTRAKTPLITAENAPSTKAGKFPPPNSLSHGPQIIDTNICISTKLNFYLILNFNIYLLIINYDLYI